MAASLVPSRGACSSRQREGAGSSLPLEWGARTPTAPGATPQVLRPCEVFRDIRCLSWNHPAKYNCVHFADKKPNPSEVRGASLFPCLHTRWPEICVRPDGPASRAHRNRLRLSTWAAGGPRPVPPQGAAGRPCPVPPKSCRTSTPCSLPLEAAGDPLGSLSLASSSPHPVKVTVPSD